MGRFLPAICEEAELLKEPAGAKETDASGTTFNIEVSDVCAAPFYKGIIPTDDGDIDASTGKKVEKEGE